MIFIPKINILLIIQDLLANLLVHNHNGYLIIFVMILKHLMLMLYLMERISIEDDLQNVWVMLTQFYALCTKSA